MGRQVGHVVTKLGRTLCCDCPQVATRWVVMDEKYLTVMCSDCCQCPAIEVLPRVPVMMSRFWCSVLDQLI